MILKNLLGSPLPTNTKAPEFKLKDQSGREHSLSEYLGRWVVLYFYPKDFTFGCTREACSFRDESPWFQENNIAVLGVSTDEEKSHQGFAAKNNLNFPLLSDTEKKTSQDYGVLMFVGRTNRVTFLINPEGTIADVLTWIPWFSYAKVVIDRLSKLRQAARAS